MNDKPLPMKIKKISTTEFLKMIEKSGKPSVERFLNKVIKNYNDITKISTIK